jgi:hypothetical protein
MNMMMTELKIDGTLLYKPSGDNDDDADAATAYEHSRTRNFAVHAHYSNRNSKSSSPALIAQVASVSDIQKCASRIRQGKNLSVTVRSGGHNWFGCYLLQATGGFQHAD